MKLVSVYYNDNDNTFEDEGGQIEYDISGIMPFDQLMFYKKNGGTYYSTVKGEDYEIEFPVRGEAREIYYDVVTNMFEDEDGDFIFNIYNIVTPNALLLFKKHEESVFVSNVKGGIVHMVYPFGG